MSILNRRDFMKKTLVSGAAFSVVPRYVLGGSGYTQPSDKIGVAIIGTGGRMNVLIDAFVKQPDLEILALCDVNLPKVTEFGKTKGIKADIFQDYRILMERKDIGAVVVCTPDHNHAPIAVAAFMAGKDVYLEKPVSNTIPAAVQILNTAREYNRVVQVGTQQRSFPHYQECFRMIKDGVIGDVHQVFVTQAGGGYASASPAGQDEPIPEGLDWELWQGPAPRHRYASARLRWRGWYEYGGGGITDWGVHQVDIVNMYMGMDGKAPLVTSAFGLENPNPELVPASWTISYKYDDFLMSFVSVIPATTDIVTGAPIFFGSLGSLAVNRWGYEIRPLNVGSWITSMGANRPDLGPTVESKSWYTPDEVAAERASELVHVRNWVDCIKSREKPVCDIEVGFSSSLPLLLSVQSVRDGYAYEWDASAQKVKAVC